MRRSDPSNLPIRLFQAGVIQLSQAERVGGSNPSPPASFGWARKGPTKMANLEFDRSLWSEPEKLVELFGMKYLTIRIDDVNLPPGFKQSSSLRHGNDRTGIGRSLAFLALF